MRTFLLTSSALICFAANSLLTRGALGADRLDAASFTGVRLVTGALALALLVQLRGQPAAERGSWRSAAALAGYAIAFTLAYQRIGASVGALVLFGSVQVTMIGTGLVRGERPARIDWAGVALALAGLLIFTIPGVNAPDVLGSALMAAAGACWGIYSLAGRGSRDPLGATAGNFGRAALFGLIFAAVSFPSRHVTPSGLWLAAASGSLASGVGYTLWYTALPALSAWRAGIVQLVVPVLTALSAAALLGESITARLLIAAVLVAAGVVLTLAPGWHRR
jgi:drug/metabolite transporter (DMT)-like permease